MSSKRSLWKGPFINNNFLLYQKKKIIKTNSRSTVILPFLIGKSIKLHNGKFYILIKIKEEMVGHKLGEFVLTRLRHIYKKNK